MDKITKKHNIRKWKDLYNGTDICCRMVNSKNHISYMDRFRNKIKNPINGDFYLTEEQFMEILNQSYSVHPPVMGQSIHELIN